MAIEHWLTEDGLKVIEVMGWYHVFVAAHPATNAALATQQEIEVVDG